MKICYIGINEDSRKAVEGFCKGYECDVEYLSATTENELVSALKKAFRDNLIIVNIKDLHLNNIKDEFLSECFTQYREIKSELILYTDGDDISSDIKVIGYATASSVKLDAKTLEKWFAAYGFKIVPKKAEKDFFSSLLADDEEKNSLFGDIDEIVKENIMLENSKEQKKEQKKSENVQKNQGKLNKQNETVSDRTKDKKSNIVKTDNNIISVVKPERKQNKPRVMSLEEKEETLSKNDNKESVKESKVSKKSPNSKIIEPIKVTDPEKAVEHLENSKLPTMPVIPTTEKISKEKPSEVKKDGKREKKPVPLTMDSIDNLFASNPVLNNKNDTTANNSSKEVENSTYSHNNANQVPVVPNQSPKPNAEPKKDNQKNFIGNNGQEQQPNFSQTVPNVQVLQKNTAPHPSFQGKTDFDVPAQRLTVGIIGSVHRIGTTTQAVQLTRFLSSIGRSVCYVQDNDSTFLDMLTKYYYGVNVDTGSECILYDGLFLNRKKNLAYDKKYEAEIYDYGCPQNIPSDFFDKNVRIVVCGGSPEEVEGITALIPQLYADENIHYVYSFVAHHDKANVLEMMGDRKVNCYFAPYSPDIFSTVSEETADMYYDILNIEKPKKKRGLFKRGNKDAKVQG